MELVDNAAHANALMAAAFPQSTLNVPEREEFVLEMCIRSAYVLYVSTKANIAGPLAPHHVTAAALLMLRDEGLLDG